MSTEVSSIDDLLMTNRTPSTPSTSEEMEVDYDESSEPVSYEEPEDDGTSTNTFEKESEESQPEPEKELDDYGNEKAAPRTYTEEEVNERINRAVRDRLSRGASTQQPNVQQTQQQAQSGFEYNPDSQESWQQQLEQFVESTVTRMSQKQTQQIQAQKEQEAHSQFEQKFTNGMEKFSDFRDVVSSQPITDPMTLSLRAMKDPAAFIYAASKRHPQELQRISNIGDPYSQMVEMGKLEERMRKGPVSTKAPRPLSRTTEDAGMKQTDNSNKTPSIEQMIKQSEAKKMALLRQRRGR